MTKEENNLPADNKSVLGWHKAINGSLIPMIVQYSRGRDIEVGDEHGDRDDLNYSEEKDQTYLTEGWYECCEQSGGTYDEIYFKRDVIKWQPLDDRDAQTIAGIELALKKVKELADQQYIERPMGNECSAYNAGISDMLGVLGFIDPAAIVSELKNDIKEG